MSTSAGTEMQRPLATAAIGGLVTATLLTLLALPSLYPAIMDAKAPFWRRVRRWAGSGPRKHPAE